ncbi:MAG: 23S rRNA (pseudouridine(1915)-N(3))-methyltransferase RlmH [Rhodospirillales bacterium]|nr:23S rRNA (pseudouridine(1915)-N(3))-methyltransferase RlmH [Rhodospirillales bacterium]
MRLVVAAVGRGRGDPAQQLFEDYRKRLPWPLELREVRAGGGGETGRAREAAALLKGLPADAYVVALDGAGKALTSEKFAAKLASVRDDGRAVIAFLIGGADGHGAPVLTRADLVLSLGPMTWPHLLVRAMLAEQLWRAASILSGHPYHRG